MTVAPSFNIPEEEKPESDPESSPSTPRQLPSSIDESINNIGSPLLSQHYGKKKGGAGGKLQFGMNRSWDVFETFLSFCSAEFVEVGEKR